MREPDTSKIGKGYSRQFFLKAVALLGLPIVAMGIWSAADNAGFLTHDEMTVVYSQSWQVGESKICTTINGNGAGAPELTHGTQNIRCDSGASSGQIEDGKMLKVRFEGRTYVAPEDVKAALAWSCRKNSPDADPPITCQPDPERDPAP